MKRFAFLAAILAALLWCSQLATAQPAAASARRATVSLTFDDGQATQFGAARILASHGMHGTFYVNSAMLGVGPWYMTWDQVHSLAAQGNEIGGHTLDHKDLTKIPLKQAFTEIRADRANLLRQGFPAASMAYPYGVTTPEVEQIVKEAGYSSARGVGGGPQAIPPYAPYFMQSATDLGQHYTLKALKADVRQAEAAGNWVILVFHQFDMVSSESISSGLFTSFLNWLQDQPVSVKTVGQVMGPGTRTVPSAKSPSTPVIKPPKATIKPTPTPTTHKPSAEEIAAARLAAFEKKLHKALVFKLVHEQ